jgi:hypothetical protein
MGLLGLGARDCTHMGLLGLGTRDCTHMGPSDDDLSSEGLHLYWQESFRAPAAQTPQLDMVRLANDPMPHLSRDTQTLVSATTRGASTAC